MYFSKIQSNVNALKSITETCSPTKKQKSNRYPTELCHPVNPKDHRIPSLVFDGLVEMIPPGIS